MIDIPELDVYYEDCVIGGPGAFIVPVRERPQFADAIRNKLVLEVAGERVPDLATMLRRIWALGPAGVAVPLTLARDGNVVRLTVRSGDRNDFLRKPMLH